MENAPQIIAWEVTRRCPLRCRHCRGAALDLDYAGEFSTDECLKTIAAVTRRATPMLILTGGEPLMRDDIFTIADDASKRGCRVVLATCGHRVSPATVARLKQCGVMAVSVSLDAASAQAHDAFRGVRGACEKTLDALQCFKAGGMPFQINTTVSKQNVHELPRILETAVQLGAATVDFFFLVPTGRGAELADMALEPDERDDALRWIAGQEHTAPLRVKTTCAPRYARFRTPDPTGRVQPPFRGCMGGRGFVFLSHTGVLQPCGFLNVPCGDLRASDFDFYRLYDQSEVFERMRRRNPFDECPARQHAHGGAI